MQQSVINRTLMVASGRFAPGHLGELTQQVPFELVDAALAQTGRTQTRLRDLPARVVVYLLLAGCLFAELGYVQVWQRLCAGLDGLQLATPTASALTQARRRLGAAPLRALFELLCGPAPTAATGGVRVGGLLVCAIDGTTLSVADTPQNLAAYAKQPGHHGGSGYPLLRLVALVACGTRSLIAAAYGPTSSGETTMTTKLIGHLHAGMLVLCDRNLTTNTLARGIAATDAHLLGRCKADRKLPVLRRLQDGSYLSVMGGVTVRVIAAEITVATRAGRATGSYRLATTLTDARGWPAATLVALYHQRWEIETAYLELKSSILGGRVLRARTPQGIDQEVYALLVCYQLLRLAMADATSTHPGIDPDRASFTVALQAARDQLIQAAGVIAATTVDLVGRIGRAVLDNLLADRRLRVSPRIVKRAISKYNARGPNINRTSYKATLSINILTPPGPLTTRAGP
ncbi:MAG TPA: IS4 family transposase [Actinomycetes bacterium]|nr:IS4 family transposase [Actinomycetes bacterium]